VKRAIAVGLAVSVLVACGMTQSKDAHPIVARKKVFINGTLVGAGKVIVKEGVPYVDVSALADALGASIETGDTGVAVTTPTPKGECDKSTAEGQQFSQQFRSAVAGVPDEIESLRAVVMKREKVPLGPRFDTIDRKLTQSTAHVQTDADTAVYYALTYANNSLAIAYFKESRGVPVEEAQKDQLDSMLCSMESKFALMKGLLLPGGSCSVFRRLEAHQSPKTSE